MVVSQARCLLMLARHGPDVCFPPCTLLTSGRLITVGDLDCIQTVRATTILCFAVSIYRSCTSICNILMY